MTADATDGFELAKSEGLFLPVSDCNDVSLIYLIASTAGQRVSYKYS